MLCIPNVRLTFKKNLNVAHVRAGGSTKAPSDTTYTGGEDLEFEDFARLRRGASVDQP